MRIKVVFLLTFSFPVIAFADIAGAPPPKAVGYVDAEIVVAADAIDPGTGEGGTGTDTLEPDKTILGKNELRHVDGQVVGTVLRQMPGLQVRSQGGIGQVASLYIRGASPEHALILIDGIEVNDPSNPTRNFDLSSLQLENIERLEVYRGPQSIRFGANAIGGVVQALTRQGDGLPVTSASLETGSFGTIRGHIGDSGRRGHLRYSLGLGTEKSDGISAAAAENGNTERDGLDRHSFSSRLTWDLAPLTTLDVTTRLLDTTVDLDRTGGANGDDPNYTSNTKQLLVGATGRTRLLDGHVGSSLGFYFSEISRAAQNEADSKSAETLHASSLSDNQKIESIHEYAIDEKQTLTLALQWRNERGRYSQEYFGTTSEFARKHASVGGGSLQYSFEGQSWFLSSGLRGDWHSRFNDVMTYSVTTGWKCKPTATTFSVGRSTAFRAPALDQLYAPKYGNLNLRPERSDGWEATAVQKLRSEGRLTLTYFQNRFSDLVSNGAVTLKYVNIAHSTTKGIETDLSWNLGDSVSLKGGYTYLDARDEDSHLPLYRRPMHTWSNDLRYERHHWSTSIGYQFVGRRGDIDPVSFRRIKMPSYDVVRVAARYALSAKIALTARIENIFDRTYQDVAGYGTPRMSAYVGIIEEL